MDAKKMYCFIQDLKGIFDIVRLVDTDRMEICELNETGSVTRLPYKCFLVWGKKSRCMNCISAKACMTGDRLEKFEFINNEVYHVISKRVTVGEAEYALELVTKTNDEALFEAYGKTEFIKAICDMNKKMYEDISTGLKNRRYYTEQKARLDKAEAVALIDIDDFKKINDLYGHAFGDVALKAISDTVADSVKETDTVIRYGGDEIYILFGEMPEEALLPQLELIRERVGLLAYPGKPGLRITVSIGGCWKGSAAVDFFEEADKKVYLAKQRKNCTEI